MLPDGYWRLVGDARRPAVVKFTYLRGLWRWFRDRTQTPVVLRLQVRSCTDRQARGFEYRLPELKAAGRCNSSHGGSCCACGGPLPDVHSHLSAECVSCSIRGEHGGFGGNVCSEDCEVHFIRWLEDSPPRLSICPGHAQDWGGGSKVFGSWGRHQRHLVERAPSG